MDQNQNTYEAQPQYTAAPVQAKPKIHLVAIFALVCGIVGCFFNPLTLLTPASVILGIIGLIIGKGTGSKVMSGIALGLGVCQFGVEVFLAIFSLGLTLLI